MKKFISILLALVLALSLSATALAADKGDKNAKDTSKNDPKTPVVSAELSSSDAEDAGLTRGEVKSLHAYGVYDRNHQVTTYCVEFAVFDREASETTVYSYVIAVPTGDVVSSNTTVGAHR